VEELVSFLAAETQQGLLPSKAISVAAVRFSITVHEVEEAALANDLLPARYQRNQSVLSTEQQLRLLRARVAVIGCGGLGGYAIEELARLGVGHLVAVDPDVFEDHNLNRQLLATTTTIGMLKVEAAAERVAVINPAVEVTPIAAAFTRANGARVLEGVNVTVDGLDNIPARLDLASACGAASVPLVHGAVAGWYGRVATQHPGDGTLEALYPDVSLERGVETDLGVLPCSAAVVASLQVAEVTKILVAEGTPLRHRCLTIDLREGEVAEITFGRNKPRGSR